MTKKFLLGLAICMWLMTGTNALAQCYNGSIQSGDYCYFEFAGEVTIEKYLGSGGDVVIPDTIAGMPVVGIEDDAFFAKSAITSLAMPNTITFIGDSAFQYCSGITSLTLPDGLITIEASAFSGCDGLTSLVIPASVTNIGWRAFSSCDNLVSVTIGDCAGGGSGITNIGEGTFYYCGKLRNVIIGDCVASIGDNAFYDCSNLVNLTIGRNVNTIGNRAFYNCDDLTDFDVHADNAYYSTIDGVLYNKDQTVLVQYPTGRTDTAFSIPEGVTGIDAYAFIDCRNLQTITMPDSLTSIGEGAFQYCFNLREVTIGVNVSSIGSRPFYECPFLESVDVASGNAYYTSDDGVLYDKDQTVLIQYPRRKTDTTYILPYSVTTIEPRAFYGCDNLMSVDLPDGLSIIGDEAFVYCYNLMSITIPGSITSIGSGAFQYCENLTSVTIEDSATSGTAIIGRGAFSGCTYLTNVTLGTSVRTIEAEAFMECSALSSINIPDSVTTIGFWAFHQCRSLESVTFGTGLTTIGPGAFEGCDGLTNVTIPDNVLILDVGAFGRCSGLTSVTIGNGVMRIGGSAFDYCSKLTDLTIGDSVITIGDYAFTNCTNLTSVTIPGSVIEIEDSAFSNCSALSAAYFLGNAPDMGWGVFNNTAPDFSICYTPDATQFTTPTWADYPAAPCACSYDSDCTENEICVDGICAMSADDPPILDLGPFITAGAWPMLPTAAVDAPVFESNQSILWFFTDDFISCSEDCTHSAQYQADGDTQWTPLTVYSIAAQEFAWVDLPIEQLQNATYAFQFSVTDCAGQGTNSDIYYFAVDHFDQPPIMSYGPVPVDKPWLARGLSKDPASPDEVEQEQFAIGWIYEDDFVSCPDDLKRDQMSSEAYVRQDAGSEWTALPVDHWTWMDAFVCDTDQLPLGQYEFYYCLTDCSEKTVCSDIRYIEIVAQP